MGGLRPWHIILIVVVLVLLFGAKRLPDAARSLGRSLRIIKAETQGLINDNSDVAEKADAQHSREPLNGEVQQAYPPQPQFQQPQGQPQYQQQPAPQFQQPQGQPQYQQPQYQQPPAPQYQQPQGPPQGQQQPPAQAYQQPVQFADPTAVPRTNDR
jgi:sec-independent protein translocase protein TatA